MARPQKAAYEITDAEKRDLIQLIQEGKALPEKYRFVLFEDKREVELVDTPVFFSLDDLMRRVKTENERMVHISKILPLLPWGGRGLGRG